MSIESIASTGASLGLVRPDVGARPSAPGFADALGDALKDLSALQQRSQSLTIALATNQPVDLHEVVLASEESGLAFQLAIQLRNKVVEAYQEVMRMQV